MLRKGSPPGTSYFFEQRKCACAIKPPINNGTWQCYERATQFVVKYINISDVNIKSIFVNRHII